MRLRFLLHIAGENYHRINKETRPVKAYAFLSSTAVLYCNMEIKPLSTKVEWNLQLSK